MSKINNYPRAPRVYVAGPLNAMAVEYLHHVHTMMEYAERLRLAGFAVYVPALDFLMGVKFGYQHYEEYFNNSQPWLDAADAVFLCPGWEHSKGTAREIQRAKSHGIPTFTDLTAIRAWAADWRPTHDTAKV